MGRYHYWQYLLNHEGQPIKSADISIYKAGTDDPVYVYNAESGGSVTNVAPQVTTNSAGYFEFWIGDNSESYGYPLGQKYKIAWSREGVSSGNIDYVDISPDISPVDETDKTSTEKDKLISNLLAYTWNEHTNHDVTSDGFPIHGITFINLNDTDEEYNRLISNDIGKKWEDHRIFDFSTYTSETTASSGAHSLAAVNKDDTSVIYNKLVSNQLINDIYANLDVFSDSLYTDFDAQEAVGNILENDGNVNFTYSPSGDLTNPSITASVSASDIDHDLTFNFISNEHINHSNVTISTSGFLNGGGDLTSSFTIGLTGSDINHDSLLNFVSNEHIDHSTITLGTSGVLNGGGGDLTSSFTIGLDNSDIDHDQTSNFVSNEHIDHSSVTFTGNNGLSGGGDLTSSKTLNLSISSLTEATSADTTNDYLVLYNGTHEKISPENLGISGGSGGSGLPLLVTDNMSLDDTDTASSRGDAFNMIESVDFSSGADGSVWITFHFPSTLDDSKDINLLAYYNLNSADDSTIVRFNTYYWSKSIGETPDSGTPDGTNTDDISTGTGENNAIRNQSLTVIPASAIATNDVITLKFQREGSNVNDTYSGTFQLLHVFPYQN